MSYDTVILFFAVRFRLLMKGRGLGSWLHDGYMMAQWYTWVSQRLRYMRLR